MQKSVYDKILRQMFLETHNFIGHKISYFVYKQNYNRLLKEIGNQIRVQVVQLLEKL